MKSKLEIDADGNKRWISPKFGLHREDGPAIEYANGDISWWLNGNMHRENGPAFQSNDGYRAWYLNGIQYTKKEYKKKMRLIKLKHILD